MLEDSCSPSFSLPDLKVIHAECVKIPPWAKLTVGTTLRAGRIRVNMVYQECCYIAFLIRYWLYPRAKWPFLRVDWLHMRADEASPHANEAGPNSVEP